MGLVYTCDVSRVWHDVWHDSRHTCKWDTSDIQNESWQSFRNAFMRHGYCNFVDVGVWCVSFRPVMSQVMSMSHVYESCHTSCLWRVTWHVTLLDMTCDMTHRHDVCHVTCHVYDVWHDSCPMTYHGTWFVTWLMWQVTFIDMTCDMSQVTHELKSVTRLYEFVRHVYDVWHDSQTW